MYGLAVPRLGVLYTNCVFSRGWQKRKKKGGPEIGWFFVSGIVALDAG